MPFFSVIIPTYNRSSIIEETIISVINQEYSDWECIIVDDGSSDNTAMVINAITKSDSRIKYIYQDNAERSAARNRGIKHASGKYICFLDSDDLYREDHLKKLYGSIQKTKEEVGLFFVNQTMLIDGVVEKTSPIIFDNSRDYFIKHSVIPARVCIHHSILSTLSFNPNIVIVEDSVLWTQIAHSFPVFQVNEDSVFYRWHDDNSVNIKNNCFLPRLNGLKILFSDQEIKNSISKKSRNEAISNCYYGIAKYYALKKKFFPMLINSIKSILIDIRCKQNKAKIYMIYEYFR